MSNSRKHEFEIEIGATPEELWQAMTEAEGIQRWFAPEARVTPGEGGKVTLSWGPGMEGTAPIHRWEPPRRFGWTEGEKLVEVEIEAVEGGRTRLRLVQSGFGIDARFDDEYDSTHGGWLCFLALLRYGAEQFRGRPMRQVHQMRMLSQTREEGFAQLLASMGLGAASLTAEGAPYTAQLAGLTIRGIVIRHPKPGYLVLSTATGMVALFVEKAGPSASMLTIQWFAAGEAAIAEAAAVKEALGGFADGLAAGRAATTA